MPETPSTHEEEVRAFWAHYVKKSWESSVKALCDRWLLVRAHESVRAHPGPKLAKQSPGDVDAYLAALGRKREVAGRQPGQAADAILMPLELAGVARADWQESVRDLGRSQPTVPQDSESVAVDGASGVLDALPFAAIRAAHGSILERASAVARVRLPSIRTGQTCRHWVIRSIGVLGNADPAEQGAGEVAGKSFPCRPGSTNRARPVAAPCRPPGAYGSSPARR